MSNRLKKIKYAAEISGALLAATILNQTKNASSE